MNEEVKKMFIEEFKRQFSPKEIAKDLLKGAVIVIPSILIGYYIILPMVI